MKVMMFGACLAAAFGGPALGQPYDQPDPYYDQAPPAPQPQPTQPAPAPDRRAGPYQDDRGYDQQARSYAPQERTYDEGQDYGRVYQRGPALRTYSASSPWARYTGRVGRAWRSPDGELCAWRQLTWQDAYGRQAYQWVPLCRYD